MKRPQLRSAFGPRVEPMAPEDRAFWAGRERASDAWRKRMAEKENRT